MLKKFKNLLSFKEGRKGKGQILVEFIYTFPILMLILLAGLDFTRIFTRELELNFAAYMGARIAAVHAGSDTLIVRKHLNAYSSLYSKIANENTKIELETDPQSGVKYIVLKRTIFPLTPFLWWDSIPQVVAAPFFEESIPSPYVTYNSAYRYRGQESYNGKPIIKSLTYKFKDDFAKEEAIIRRRGGDVLSNLLPQKWYPQSVVISSGRWLAALMGEIWAPGGLTPMALWWGSPFTGGLIMDKPSQLTTDAMIYRMLHSANPYTRRYTGFLVGYGKVSFSGGGISPPPEECWDNHANCGPDGFYNASAWNGWFWNDNYASHYAFATDPCVDPVIVCDPWGCHCVWCNDHEWTPVFHSIHVHAGGAMWEHNGKYWNYYNAIWALAALPEVYATSVYNANYQNIEGDCWHNCWMGRPDYAPDMVNFIPGFKDYLNQLENAPPYDEQQHSCKFGRGEGK